MIPEAYDSPSSSMSEWENSGSEGNTPLTPTGASLSRQYFQKKVRESMLSLSPTHSPRHTQRNPKRSWGYSPYSHSHSHPNSYPYSNSHSSSHSHPSSHSHSHPSSHSYSHSDSHSHSSPNELSAFFTSAFSTSAFSTSSSRESFTAERERSKEFEARKAVFQVRQNQNPEVYLTPHKVSTYSTDRSNSASRRQEQVWQAMLVRERQTLEDRERERIEVGSSSMESIRRSESTLRPKSVKDMVSTWSTVIKETTQPRPHSQGDVILKSIRTR